MLIGKETIQYYLNMNTTLHVQHEQDIIYMPYFYAFRERTKLRIIIWNTTIRQ